MVRFLAGLFGILVAACLAPAAMAQFGGQSFEPPRPPANIPSQPDAHPPQVQQPGPPPGGQIHPRDDIQSQPLPPPPAANQIPPAARPQPPAAQMPPTQMPPNQNPAGEAPAPNIAVQPPSEEPVPEPPTPKIANPTAVFSGLDKITGRITSFDVAINETVRFGALEVTPRVCYTRPPTELPQTDGFVEVDELTLQGELRRIFTGWMFAASPGLNAVEHPIYDVWLTDCKGGAPPTVATEAPPVEPPAPARPSPRPPARPQAAPR